MAGVLRRGAWTGNLPVWEGNARGPDAAARCCCRCCLGFGDSVADGLGRSAGRFGGGAGRTAGAPDCCQLVGFLCSASAGLPLGH